MCKSETSCTSQAVLLAGGATLGGDRVQPLRLPRDGKICRKERREHREKVNGELKLLRVARRLQCAALLVTRYPSLITRDSQRKRPTYPQVSICQRK